MSGEIHNAIYSMREGAGWTTLGRAIEPSIATDPRAILDALGPYVVRKLTAGYQMPDGTWVAVPERSCLVGVWDTVESAKGIAGADGANERDSETQFFEFTSNSRYHIDYRQPLDIVESFRDELARESLEISHAASLKGGRIMTVCARLRDLDTVARVAGDSDTAVYLCASSGYDKAHGTEYWITIVRMVCANTRRAGIADAENKGTLVRRTAAQRFTSASDLRSMLDAAMGLVKADAATMQALADTHISSDDARAFFAKLLDIDMSKIGVRNADGRPLISTRSQNQLSALAAAFVRSPGAHLPAADGTLYGAVNAVTYIVDHESQIRDTMREGNQRARMSSATFGAGNALKARAVRAAAELLSNRVLVAA